MANETSYHPSELAYLLSYESVDTVIGWGPSPFAPPKGGKDAFYEGAIARLTKAMRLLPGKQPGRYRFSDEAKLISGALADPQIVIVTNRKERDGIHILTHHVKGETIVELSLGKDGNFHILEYPTLAGPAGAAAAFVGATANPVSAPVRIEASQKILANLKSLAKTGQSDAGVSVLKKLGADDAAARSIMEAFRASVASGVVSVMYCAGNVAHDAETYAVFTNQSGQSWVAFPPASIEGPVVLETTSVGALAGRILVAISARMVIPV